MAKWILFAHNGMEYGPVEEEKIISWIKEKRVSVDDVVKMEGSRQWEIAGDVNLFSPYFKNRPTEAGRIKRGLKNDSEKLIDQELETISSAKGKKSACDGCTFIETVERLHEEKKILEEKLANEKGRLRESNLMEKDKDKPQVIEENRERRRRDFAIYSLLIAAIVISAFVWQGLIFKKKLGNEKMAKAEEEIFYKKRQEEDRSRMAALSQELENLNKEKNKIEARLSALLSEKEGLEKEKDNLLKNLQQAEARTKEVFAGKELELKERISREYKNEIDALKEKVNKTEKLEEELLAKKNILESLENGIKARDEEIKSLTKANQSNEYLMKKIEDLNKIRYELEEELRSKNKK